MNGQKQGQSWSGRVLPVLTLVVVAGLILVATVAKSQRSEEAAPVADAAVTVAQQPPPIAYLPNHETHAPVRSSTPDPQRRQEAEAKQARRSEAKFAAFSSRYAQEKIDASWAIGKEATVIAASGSEQIAQLKAEPTRLDVDCKTTTCRVEAEFVSRTQAEDWFTLISMGLGTEMPSSTYKYSFNPDGSTRLVVYGLSRQ